MKVEIDITEQQLKDLSLIITGKLLTIEELIKLMIQHEIERYYEVNLRR